MCSVDSTVWAAYEAHVIQLQQILASTVAGQDITTAVVVVDHSLSLIIGVHRHLLGKILTRLLCNVSLYLAVQWYGTSFAISCSYGIY